MQTALIGIGLATVLFLCPSLLWAYRRGLRDGLALNQGAKTIAPIRNPMQQAMEQRREATKANKEPPPDTFIDSLLKGHANMMAFTGDLPEEKR